MSQDEFVKFMYFSESGECGENSQSVHHEKYCNDMLSQGFILVNITPLGNLDDRRDSYEGTVIYHWRKKEQTRDRGAKEDLK